MKRELPPVIELPPSRKTNLNINIEVSNEDSIDRWLLTKEDDVEMGMSPEVQDLNNIDNLMYSINTIIGIMLP